MVLLMCLADILRLVDPAIPRTAHTTTLQVRTLPLMVIRGLVFIMFQLLTVRPAIGGQPLPLILPTRFLVLYQAQVLNQLHQDSVHQVFTGCLLHTVMPVGVWLMDQLMYQAHP